MKLFRIITFTVCCIIAFNTYAQEKDIVFEQITNESGRSLGFVTGIVQDKTGFMWFGTNKGLYRYNGYSYKLFRKNASDSLSLPHNSISGIYIDKQDVFWIKHYEEFSAFKDEKVLTEFDSITGIAYDNDVHIVQDKKGFYWIGPTKNGLIRYNHKNKVSTYYTCPPKTYNPKSWNRIAELLSGNNEIASIVPHKNNIDTSVQFSISAQGSYLVASIGEMDKYGKYDFGAIYKGNEKIWELSKENSVWAGGDNKNIFEASVIELQEGDYTLTYKSDISHSCAKWDDEAPNKIDFCGIKIAAIKANEKKELNADFFAPFKDSTYIESVLIKDMLIDNNGVFWALTDKGLEKYNYRKNSFEHFPIDYKHLLGREIGSSYLRIYQDRKGVFWIGSMYGLIKYDQLWGRFLVFQNTPDRQVLTSNIIYTLFEDKAGDLWIGTENGLNIYNQEMNTVRKVTQNNHNRLYDNRIYQIFEDKSGNIWVATAEGLNRLIKTPFTYTSLNIKADNNYPAHYDKAANIWFAINNKISKYSRTLLTQENYVLPDKLFNIDEFTGEADYIISDMVVGTDMNVWVATDNKLSRYNIFDNKVDFTKQLGAIIVGTDSIKNNIKKIITSTSGKLYTFCPNGMYVINSRELKYEAFYPFNTNYDFIDEVDGNYFKSARIDKNNNVWIRTSDGFYQFNTQLKKLSLIYEFENQYKSINPSRMLFDFDKYGNIWFATLPILYQLNIETHKVNTWEFNFDHDWSSSSVMVGSNKIYSYGSNGLYSFDTETEEVEYASLENGFIDNNITGIEEDNLGYLWLTGLKGLIKYDPVEKKSKNYFTASDFSSQQFLGNPQEFKVNSSEKILFTTTGFITFFPDSINRTIPPVVIDKISIRGKEKLDSLIYYKKHLNLKYNQNRIELEFAILDYTEPSENRYKYMLEGLDEEWNISDATNRRASYPGLAPGRYTLKVLGANNDKVWNEDGVRLNILITPPWYKTIAAYIAYILLTIASIWIFVRIREQKLQEEKQILEQKVKERTAQIEAQKEELAEQKDIIERKNRDMEDSIQYAQRIQEAILPPIERITEVVDDYFVLWRPRDIVSGDYYWSNRKDDITIIVAADCTGHGVPGAFMSMLGIAFLNEIVIKEGITEPNQILDRLREQIITQLHQTGEEGESKDGMDVSLYLIDHKNMKLKFSGAYNPLFIIRDGEVMQLKADRMPIGYYIKKDVPFSIEEFELQKGDCLYNSSDGYPDQFGGPDERKFMTKNFKKLLVEIHQKPMEEQRQILDKTIDDWRGDIEQIDDIIVIGVRV